MFELPTSIMSVNHTYNVERVLVVNVSASYNEFMNSQKLHIYFEIRESDFYLKESSFTINLKLKNVLWPNIWLILRAYLLLLAFPVKNIKYVWNIARFRRN